jgi:hypothetical protein
MSHLDRLTQQLEALKAQTTPIVPAASVTSPDLSTQIQEAVKAALANELIEIRKLITSNLPKETKRDLTILEIIGLSLTPEEQVWLSSPSIQKYLPVFLQTTGGSDCIKLFVAELKAAYENKT